MKNKLANKEDWRSELERLFVDKRELEILDKFLNVLEKLQIEKRKRFDRSLPLGEHFVDRWERARELDFGCGSSIYDSAIVLGKVVVGERTWIGPNTMLDGSGGLRIGCNCSISAGVQIYSHDSVEWATSGGLAKYEYSPTSIGDNCYIGPNSVIAKGVKIGKGSVIGANSFVNQDLNSGQRVAGNPARLLSSKNNKEVD